MAAKWDVELVSSMNTPNVHLYLEQLLLRRNRGTEELLQNKEERERLHREDWELTRNLREPIRSGGASEHHCFHCPGTCIAQAGGLPGRPARLQ